MDVTFSTIKALAVTLLSFSTFLMASSATFLIAAVAAEPKSTAQKDFPTVRFYSSDGKSAGTATTYGDQIKYYGPDGKLIGTARRER